MVIIIKRSAQEKEVNELISWVKAQSIDVQSMVGSDQTILGLLGNTAGIDVDAISTFPAVEAVRRIQEPYKKSNKKFHPAETIVKAEGSKIGGGHFGIIAGPCSIESRDQICLVAENVKKSGATFLRGGAFKPRTSPYAFQGMGKEGLDLLLEAKKQTGLPIVSEIMSMVHIDLFSDVDVIQVGARNMQNFTMLRELGMSKKPILLKRGLSSTIEELLMSAEYIMAGGNSNIILCERGIRTFEQTTRNTLDLSAVPVLKSRTHLPIVVDPSHATGHASLVESMSLAATACGADGLMIEVHNDPKRAMCDGAQSLDCTEFNSLMKKIKAVKQTIQGFEC